MAGNRVEARLPEAFLKLKKEYETNTEFVMRAMRALRAQEHPEYATKSNPLEHQLLVKLVKEFAKQGIKMKLETEEIELVKRLFKE
jgi:hypothetical protein